MGEHNVVTSPEDLDLQDFMKALLEDVQALEKMLDSNLIETGISRIGSEQEMFIVDENCFPAMIAPELLSQIKDPRFTTELAKFNMEVNLTPQEFSGTCLSDLERELTEVIQTAQKAAQKKNAKILLTGILPTLQKTHLTLDNMTPNPRYFQMNEALNSFRKGDFQISIKGGSEDLELTHDNIMLEACNTSFQVHFQISPENFANYYNIAQVISAPVLAASVNSPLLFGKRLWHETRLALYQRSVDTRSTTHQYRGQKSRVHFGDKWINDSVLELFRADIAQFKLLLARKLDENSLDVLKAGNIPKLQALCLHNSTIWRWNRACYGVGDNGKPHLRIENRYIPSGPTIQDEVANAAFYFGLMRAFSNEYSDIKTLMPFADVKENFYKAASHSLSAQFTWIDGKDYTAQDLILKQLLPIAKEGLADGNLKKSDINHYMNIIKNRVKSAKTGARWILKSFHEMGPETSKDLKCRSLTTELLKNQESGKPVHLWDTAGVTKTEGWFHSYRTVDQFMSTELYTVSPDDIIDLAANIMDWEHIHHVPVEDSEGRLLGILSHRTLFRLLSSQKQKPVTVREVMKTDLITVSPGTSSLTAIQLMKDHRVGCLPIVENERLVGLITEHDFTTLAGTLLESILKEVD